MITTELKFQIGKEQVVSVKESIKKLGGLLITPRTHELHTVYDDGAGSVQVQDARLCLQSGVNHTISYERLLSRRGGRQDLVLGTTVSSLAQMKKILTRIGFQPVSRYACYRTTWEAGGCKISLCQFTFGIFIEVSGERSVMTRMSGRLGFAVESGLTQSYDELYRQTCLSRQVSSRQAFA
jgi:adenylate cyclase class IV